MNIKKTGKALLFPHIAIRMVLIPVSTVFLVYAMMFLDTDSVPAILCYVLAFYTLTVWCVKLPVLITAFQRFRCENAYIQLWKKDLRLRVKLSLYGSLLWNTAYAVFQLGLGVWHRTFWYYSLFLYYMLLAVMRLFLARHTSKHMPGEEMRWELIQYRACGIVFLVMNVALTLIIFFMIYGNRTFHHHEITTIAMAAYTFTTFTLAVIDIIKYRKSGSPVFSAAKAIRLTAACVSMLTLESTMLTTFHDGPMDDGTRRIFLGFSGGAVSAFIIVMAIHMIVGSHRKLKLLKQTKEISHHGKQGKTCL